ncbi:MTRF1L release factor glutamine methyltransferase isoform X1 [Ictalurus punctatus]|uniref:peptide chain release factor N(5)-glutamine methyltransferase n=2 Tax=Ictalurus punctatus TaxID=7998 RepID=W5UB00_ICTPU|nr:MTRF1L release factor glutamine methyltransferase isoform X1 [Ictalurus punctatus]
MMLGLMSVSSRSAWTQRSYTEWIRRGIIQQRALLWLPCGGVGGALTPPVDSIVTVEQAVNVWMQCFQQHGISEPLLSSQYIIAHVLGKKTLQSLERRMLQERLSDKERETVWALCSKRLTRMPVQYVIEEWDFRDLTLKMRPPVFIPRPETEELVSLLLKDLRSQLGVRALRCLEVGCGSGAISLSLLHSVPQLKAVALDQSQEAVCLTKENADRLGLLDRLEIYHLDILKEADLTLRSCGPVDVIVSNPPYLFSQDMESLQAEIHRFEDHSALDGGLDGMSVIRQILTLAPRLLTDEGRMYLEVDPRHPPHIKGLVEESMLGLQYLGSHCDFTNRLRFCILQKRG